MTAPKLTRPSFSWLRRTVPAGYAQATLLLEGTAPLLMHAADHDPTGEVARAYHMLGAKRSKTIDDQRRLEDIEWRLGIYYDETIGPFIPARNLKELLREAATKWKKGQEIRRSLTVIEYRVPLLYDGPRDEATLFASKAHRCLLLVANGGANAGRVFRCRPMFEDWSLAVEIAYDPEDLDLDLLQLIVERTRKYGLGDGRNIGFGSFEADLVAGDLHKAATNGSGAKVISRERLAAHVAFRERVMSESAA